MHEGDQERLRALQGELLEILSGDRSARMSVSAAEDDLDALALGINVLSEELQLRADAEHRVRDQLSRVFRTMRDGLIVADADGWITRVNAAACTLLTLDSDALIGRQLSSIYVDQIQAQDLMMQLEARDVASQEARVRGSQGILQVHVSASRSLGHSQSVVWVARDIRELKALLQEAALAAGHRQRAEELADAHAELTRAHADLQATHEQLVHAQKMEAMGLLAGGIAHDPNNILAVVIGGAQLAMKKLPEGHPARREIAEVKAAARHATALTRQLLVMSRKQPHHPIRIRPTLLVQESKGMFTRLVGDAIEWMFDLEKDCPSVMVDEVHLLQVFINLVVNARDAMHDAMHDGGLIQIRIRRAILGDALPSSLPTGDYVRIDVIDNGVGISAPMQTHIFEPFFTSKKKEQGTGLGLSTCAAIVEQAKGHLGVFSPPSGGATFTIHLPVAEGEISKVVSRHEETLPQGQGERILLAEDQPAVRIVLARQLEVLGYAVTVAVHGEEALEQFESDGHAFDLLLTDVTMPRLSGDALARKVRQKRPGLPVLFVSGYAEHPPSLDDGQGPCDHITKPFDLVTLAGTLRKLLA